MYKDKEKQKEYNRERMKRLRGSTQGNTLSNVKEGNTSLGSTEVHPLMIALSDIRIRAKLRRVCEELHKSRQLHNVLYGTRHPVSFDVVAEYLTALS